MYYKLSGNNICCTKSDDGSIVQYAPWSIDTPTNEALEWLYTDKDIIRLPDFSFVFADAPDALTAQKTAKKAEIAAARYEYEIAGVVFDGVHVTTDREDQAMITAVALSAVVDPAFTTVWKGADGYLDLDAAGVLTLARMVGAHVEAAFAEEKRLAALIDAAQDEAELASISWTLT